MENHGEMEESRGESLTAEWRGHFGQDHRELAVLNTWRESVKKLVPCKYGGGDIEWIGSDMNWQYPSLSGTSRIARYALTLMSTPGNHTSMAVRQQEGRPANFRSA